jgi:hypothetical protein
MQNPTAQIHRLGRAVARRNKPATRADEKRLSVTKREAAQPRNKRGGRKIAADDRRDRS